MRSNGEIMAEGGDKDPSNKDAKSEIEIDKIIN